MKDMAPESWMPGLADIAWSRLKLYSPNLRLNAARKLAALRWAAKEMLVVETATTALEPFRRGIPIRHHQLRLPRFIPDVQPNKIDRVDSMTAAEKPRQPSVGIGGVTRFAVLGRQLPPAKLCPRVGKAQHS